MEIPSIHDQESGWLRHFVRLGFNVIPITTIQVTRQRHHLRTSPLKTSASDADSAWWHSDGSNRQIHEPMMRPIHFLIALLTISIFEVLPSRVYSSTPEEPQKHAVFSVYSIGWLHEQDLWYEASKGDYRIVQFRRLNRSRNYDYRGSSTLVFHTKSFDDKGNAIYTPVSKCTLPEQGQQFLLLFTRSTDENPAADRTQILVSDDSPEGMPFDSIRFLNATPWQLEGTFAGNEIELAPGLSECFSVDPNPEIPVPIGLGIRINGQIEPMLMNHWTFYPGNRVLMLLLPPDRKHSKRIRAISLVQHKQEIPPPKAEHKETQMRSNQAQPLGLTQDLESGQRM